MSHNSDICPCCLFQYELERLNGASEEINKLELELDVSLTKSGLQIRGCN